MFLYWKYAKSIVSLICMHKPKTTLKMKWREYSVNHYDYYDRGNKKFSHFLFGCWILKMIVYWMLSSNCDTEAVKYWTCDDFSCKGKNRRIISLLHYICRYWQRTWNVCKKIHEKVFHHQLTILYLRIIYENMIKLYVTRYIYEFHGR